MNKFNIILCDISFLSELEIKIVLGVVLHCKFKIVLCRFILYKQA